jgi:hypothetical protein
MRSRNFIEIFRRLLTLKCSPDGNTSNVIQRIGRVTAALLSAVAITACSPHSEKTASRTVSPLIGTWTRDGSTKKGNDSGGPQFTKLKFKPNGALKASYVAGGVGAIVGSSPDVKAENDTYSTSDGSKLSIAEGTTHRDYSYNVSGSKLYLKPPDGGDAAVFTKAS